MKTQNILAAATLAMALAAGASAHAQNIVLNPGFDLDSPSGGTAPADWTFVAAASGEDFFVGPGDGVGSFSAPNAANFGAVSSFDDTLSQALSTIAGHSYAISFELAHDEDDSANDFSATFGSTTVASLVNAGSFGYTLFTGTVTATSASTTLSFAGRENPSWYVLDNVSVVDNGPAGVPEPAAWALMITGFMGAGVALRRRRAMAAAA